MEKIRLITLMISTRLTKEPSTVYFFFLKVILFRSLQPGKFHGDPIVIKPPAVNKDGMAEWRQPGTGFGYAVCGVDLNNDGWVEVLQLPKLVCGCFGPLSVCFAPCRSRLIFLSNRPI